MSLDPVTDSSEVELIRQFIVRLEQARQFNETYDRVRKLRAQSRSQLAADDAMTAWMQFSLVGGHCLDMANDNFRALVALVRDAAIR